MTEEAAAQMNYDLGHSRGFSAGVTAERERIRRAARAYGNGRHDDWLRSVLDLLDPKPATTGGTT